MEECSVDGTDAPVTTTHNASRAGQGGEVRNHMMDSTRWSDFVYRQGDIVIGTWAKTGTTWIQQIVAQLLFDAADVVPLWEISPWIEDRHVPKEQMIAALEAQTHRRFVKTHLPADILRRSRLAKYIYIARDGRDVLWSWHNHHKRLPDRVLKIINGPGRVGPPLEPPDDDIRRYFHQWLDQDGYPLWPFWSHVQSWWNVRHDANVLLLHFNNSRTDLPAVIRRIAAFLEIKIDEALWPRILQHCSFEYMKEHAASFAPLMERSFVGGARAFIYRGDNGRWRDTLSAEDVEKYERTSAANLTPDCDRWLRTGETPGHAASN